MLTPSRIGLNEAEKDALLVEQQEMIERLVAWISELEALVGKPRKTSSDSHIAPSKDGFGKGKRRHKPSAGKRPPREGKARPLTETPDKTERVVASACCHCGTDVSGQSQRCRHRYDHIDLPPIQPIVTRVELFGGRCRGCGRRYRAEAPAGMPPGPMASPSGNGCSSRTRRCCTRSPHRARSVAEEVLGGHQPDVWVSDRYAGQQELGKDHQVCLAHVLRDVQYAIDCGDTIFAPQIRDHLRWAIRIGRRRHELKDSTLASYAAKADHKLTHLMRAPVAHPARKVLLKQIKAWRAKFFVFLTNRAVPATNNISEREIRPSVVFRKVTNGFRSDWRAQIHAGYRSVTGTARLSGKSALVAIRSLVDGKFAIACSDLHGPTP